MKEAIYLDNMVLETNLRLKNDLTYNTVKPVLVATSIKQATCIKQASVKVPKGANTSKCTCIKQAPVLSKHI